jgi:urease accessory protein
LRTGEGIAAGPTLPTFLIVSRASQINIHGRKNGKPAIKLAARRSKAFSASEAISSIAKEKTDDWLLWQLCDSAFPTGGFAHSLGLEAAWQHGEVRNRTQLVSFIEAGLHQLGHAALPFVTAAFAEPAKLGEFDQLCDTFMTNHVANRASRAQGRAMQAGVERIFKAESGKRKAELPFAHFAPVFGACLRSLEVTRETALRIFVFNQLRAVLAAAVRLNIVGPMEAQMLQHRLAQFAEKILQACAALSLEDLAQTSPLLDLWQGAQDRLYSRLFQS